MLSSTKKTGISSCTGLDNCNTGSVTDNVNDFPSFNKISYFCFIFSHNQNIFKAQLVDMFSWVIVFSRGRAYAQLGDRVLKMAGICSAW